MGTKEPPVQTSDMATIAAPIDFLGVNFYSRMLIQGSEQAPTADKVKSIAPVPGACYTEMGWEVYPQALTDLLVRLHEDYGIANLYITENGSAFQDQWDGSDSVKDPRRIDYLREHLHSIAKAIKAGTPVRGYFTWSLLDNYEWAEGYSKRFGIVYVDYHTQRRIIKDSGYWYADLIAKYRETYA
jgi:beta-glucosidase